MTPKLYYLPGAVCAHKALLTAAIKGCAYDAVELTREQLVSSEYLAINSKGVVPTLVDETSNVIVESSTIMRFIDERYDGRPLQPVDPFHRSQMNNWMKVMDEELFPAVGYFTMSTVLRGMFLPLSDQALSERMTRIAGPAVGAMRANAVRDGVNSVAVSSAIATWANCFRKMEAALEGQAWLAGDTLSLGDIALAPAFTRLADLGLEDWWTRSLPGVTRWWSEFSALSEVRECNTRYPNPMADGLRETSQDLRTRIRESY